MLLCLPSEETQAVLCDLYDSTFLTHLPSPTQVVICSHALNMKDIKDTIILPSLSKFHFGKRIAELTMVGKCCHGNKKRGYACCKQAVPSHQAALVCETWKAKWEEKGRHLSIEAAVWGIRYRNIHCCLMHLFKREGCSLC